MSRKVRSVSAGTPPAAGLTEGNSWTMGESCAHAASSVPGADSASRPGPLLKGA